MNPADRASLDHPLVDAFVGRFLSGPAPLIAAIDPRDEMLDHQLEIADGNLDRALFAYFRTGWAVAETYLHLLRWHFGDRGPERLLDFASGFGRVTRFLIRALEPSSIRVCEISEGAVAFQAGTFGVGTQAAARRPQELSSSERFDCILVTSLFTHLPRETFNAWLQRLIELLAPDGLLLFSVHDVSLLLPDIPLPASGFRFEPTSESRSLESAEYGSTWVSESWMQEQLRQLAPTAACHRLPFAVCDYQDLWAVRPGQGREELPPKLPPYPQGLLERCDLDGRELEIGGWLMCHSPGARLRSVRVELGGRRLAETDDFQTRPDVEDELHREHSYGLGWGARITLPPDVCRETDILLLIAVDSSGHETAIWAGTLEGTLREAMRRRLEHWRARDRERMERMEMEMASAHARVAAAEVRIDNMKRSRFWRARDLWFSVKRRLGLTEES